MGGDGGVKATKRRFMRCVKSEDNSAEIYQLTHTEDSLRVKSSICSISARPLQEPVVACELGFLYNKEEVLKVLIDKTLNSNFSHIRGLKDLTTLKFKLNSLSASHNSSSSLTTNKSGYNEKTSKYVCPISGDEFNGLIPFCFILTTGYVLSERSLKEMSIDNLQEEYGPFTSQDIIQINPTPEQQNILREIMFQRRNKKEKRKREKEQIKSEESGNKMLLLASASSSSSSLIEKENKSKRNFYEEENDKTSAATNNNNNDNDNNNLNEAKPKKLTKTTNVLNSASEGIEKQSEQSEVYRNLFHKENLPTKSRDLFTSIAGLRYTL